eukprot:gene400-504_t
MTILAFRQISGKVLDFITVFMAPRPGLEPGTYGLTVVKLLSPPDAS